MEQLPTVAAVLARARTLIEGGWSRGAPARDARGFAVEAWEVDAVSFCLTGSVECAARELWPDDNNLGLMLALQEEAEQYLAYVADCPPITFNDMPGTTKEDVLRLIDRAIAEVPK